MPIQTLMLACFFFFFLFVYCNVFFLSFTLRTVDSRGKQNSTLLSYPHLYSCFIDLAIIKGKYSLKLPRHIRTLKTSLLETTGRSKLAVPELARSESAYRHLVITLSLISLFFSVQCNFFGTHLFLQVRLCVTGDCYGRRGHEKRSPLARLHVCVIERYIKAGLQ